MSNKLSNKPSKKERPRSTDKAGKARRKGDQTPDKMTTPVQSAVALDDCSNYYQTISNVLSGDDIDSLAVNMQELEKHRQDTRPSVDRSTRQVTVMKSLKKKNGQDEILKKGKIVNVAYAVNLDLPQFKNCEKIGNKDPYFDDVLPFYEHHILGTLQEFKEENEKHNESKKIPLSHNEKTYNPITSSSVIREREFPTSIYKPNMNQSNALSNWSKHMSKRRKQQGNLAKLLRTSNEMLGMNQNEGYRATQEDRYLIDRTIHLKDYGKGYRTGSEFWKQAEQIGDDLTGIHMTLTQTERGYPPVIEHVGKPSTVRHEMGIDWSDLESYRSTTVHHPWMRSQYLYKRKNELKDAIEELCPHKPYLQELEVIGQSINDDITIVSRPGSRMDSLSPKLEEMLPNKINDTDPLSMHPDVYPQAIYGPSLMIAGRSAAWNGSTDNRVNEIGLSCRVVLQARVDERVISTLDVNNNGTAAIYYSWKHVSIDNDLGTFLAGEKQRFYFDKNSGVILPGDTLNFPFIFKSSNPGMFTEQWYMETQPILNGGAAIQVTLKGLALQEDLNAGKRSEIEKILGERQARQIVHSIMNEMLENVRSPERVVSPVDAYIANEELFARQNPQMFYDHETVEALTQLYNEIDHEGNWDLNISSLRQLIKSNHYDDVKTKDEYLSILNDHVKKMAMPSRAPHVKEMYSTCYVMLCDMIDNLVHTSDMMRNSMGLPLKDMIEDTSTAVNDKRSKKTEAGRLTVDKKDSKRERKGVNDRPISSQKSKTPSEKTKSSQGYSNVQTKLPEEENILVISVADEQDTIENTVNLMNEEKYREKYFIQAYKMVSNTVDRIIEIFEDIA